MYLEVTTRAEKVEMGRTETTKEEEQEQRADVHGDAILETSGTTGPGIIPHMDLTVHEGVMTENRGSGSVEQSRSKESTSSTNAGDVKVAIMEEAEVVSSAEGEEGETWLPALLLILLCPPLSLMLCLLSEPQRNQDRSKKKTCPVTPVNTV